MMVASSSLSCTKVNGFPGNAAAVAACHLPGCLFGMQSVPAEIPVDAFHHIIAGYGIIRRRRHDNVFRFHFLRR